MASLVMMVDLHDLSTGAWRLLLGIGVPLLWAIVTEVVLHCCKRGRGGGV